MAKEIKRNIVLVGDGAVGKTSLIRRFVIDAYSDDYIQTIGVKVMKKEMTVGDGDDETNLTLMVWDLIGQKGHKYTQSLSVLDMSGALLVCDLTRKETLSSLLSYWIPMVIRMNGPIPMVFLGNKNDLEDQHQYTLQDIKNISYSCEAFGATPSCYLTSAKTGENVETGFTQLGEVIISHRRKAKFNYEWNVLDINEIENLSNVLDHIIADFADQFGGIEYATPFIKHQIKLSGLDFNNPTEESLQKLVDNLAHIESGFKPENIVDENRNKRLKLLKFESKK